MAGIQSLINRRENRVIRSRVLRRMEGQAQRGLKQSGQAGYGYRTALINGTDKTLVIDEYEAEVIRQMAVRVLAGESLRSIAAYLNANVEHPLASRTNRIGRSETWTASTVKRILTAPRIAGERVHRGEVVGKAQWDAILDADAFAAVRRVLNAPNRRAHAAAYQSRLLTGIVRCGNCGNTLNHADTKRYDREGQPRVRRYYCRHCSRCMVRAEPIESYVRDLVCDQLDAEALRAGDPAGERDSLMATLSELDDSLTRLAQMLGAGSLTMDAFQAATVGINHRRQAAREALASLEVAAVGNPWVGRGEALRAVWDDLEDGERRAAIRTVLQSLVVGPAVRGSSVFDPSRLRVEYNLPGIIRSGAPSREWERMTQEEREAANDAAVDEWHRLAVNEGLV